MRRHHATASIARHIVLSAGGLLMTLPFIYMVSTSFKDQAYVLSYPPQLIPEPATIANYVRVWLTQDFGRYFVNSLVVAALSTAGSVLVSAMMAYAFARFRFAGRTLLFRVLLLGLMVPAMMLIIPQFVLAKSLNLLDNLQGLIVFYIAGSLALNTFLLRAFFEGIPIELEEAMEVDGANPWQRFTRLMLPLSTPALATTTIFTFLGCWDEFAWAATSINTPTNRTLPVAIRLFQGQNATQWGLVFAASTIAIIPVIAVFFAFQRYFVQGLTTGALKG